MVNEELRELAAASGITKETVLKRLADLPEAMTTDTGLLEATKMLCRLTGIPIEQPSKGGAAAAALAWGEVEYDPFHLFERSAGNEARPRRHTLGVGEVTNLDEGE